MYAKIPELIGYYNNVP